MQYESPTSLPIPDTASAAHSKRVAAHIRKRMAGGAISFAEFMQEALYAPGLGYYAAGATKLGAEGDFVTAPEVSTVFGRVIARQVAEILAGLGGGDLLEIGAGSGKLAVDMLTALQRLNALPRRFYILEVSADLAERQRRRLQRSIPELAERVTWLSDWPTQFRGVVIANEVLDALPFERFARRDSGVRQLCVTASEAGFEWAERNAPAPLARAVSNIEADLGAALPEGYVSDVSLAIPAWIADLAASLDRGAIFLFDYGVARREYYAPDRGEGWLRCHFRHHAHSDPLLLPGIQDLTSWVDFTVVASAAVDAKLDILGYLPQAQFLLGAGLDAEMQALADLPVAEQLALSDQVKTLTLPGAMGEHFKCIALGRGDVVTPSAFQIADRTQTL